MFYLVTLSVVRLCTSEFVSPDASSLVRVSNFDPVKAVAASDGVYLLGASQDTLTAAKLDLDVTAVVWSFRLALGNNATAVDIAVGQGSLWLACNVLWNSTKPLPGLVSTENPRLGTTHGLLIALSKSSGTVEWTKWLGSCLGSDSFVYSLARTRQGVLAAGSDSCSSGVWVGSDSSSRYLAGQCAAAVLSSSDQSVYLAAVCSSDVAGASHPQPGRPLPAVLKLNAQGDVLWARILTVGSQPAALLAAAVTVMPLTNLDYVAVAAIGTETALMLVDGSGALQWTVTTAIPALRGLAADASMGVLLTADGTLAWYSFDAVQRASRLYADGTLLGAPLLLSSFDAVGLLFSSAGAIYGSPYNEGTGNSAVVVRTASPFVVRNCTSVCSSCFAMRSDACFECNTFLAAPFVCGRCDAACSTCFGPDRFHCRTCADQYESVGSECVLDLQCGPGKYTDQSLRACQSCNSSCGSCSGPSAANCTSCAAGYAKNDRLCVPECPAYRYKSSGQCLDCAITCAACSGPSAQNCTKCQSPALLFEGSCVQSCPSESVQQGANCIRCAVGCRTCTAPAVCSKCEPGWSLYTTCVQSCPAGTVSVDGVCVSCPQHCAQCSQPSVCSLCSEGFYWNLTQCAPVPACPAASFFNGTRCEDCHQHCESCWGDTARQCYRCRPEWFLRNTTCEEPLTNCSRGFFLSSNNTCERCASNCSFCLNSTVCQSCDSPFLLSQGSCLSLCSGGFFPSNSSCVPCSGDCELCNATQCFQCKSGRFLEAGNCVEFCSAGAIPISGACVPCADNCAMCAGSECAACLPGFYLSFSECRKCPQECSRCSSSTTCSDCSGGFYLLNSSCLQECPLGYAGVGSVCETCRLGCDQCTSPEVCVECSVSAEFGGRYSLTDGVCDLSSPMCYPGFSVQNGTCTADNEHYSHDFLSAAVWLASV